MLSDIVCYNGRDNKIIEFSARVETFQLAWNTRLWRISRVRGKRLYSRLCVACNLLARIVKFAVGVKTPLYFSQTVHLNIISIA